VGGQQHVLAVLYPRERPGTHFTGGWVGRRAGLDRWKISSPPGFSPGYATTILSIFPRYHPLNEKLLCLYASTNVSF